MKNDANRLFILLCNVDDFLCISVNVDHEMIEIVRTIYSPMSMNIYFMCLSRSYVMNARTEIHLFRYMKNQLAKYKHQVTI
jgi:hypothetical protein